MTNATNMKPEKPIRLYRLAKSGHAHRAELMLALLGLPHELVEVDMMNGAHKKPEFLALNPFGQVPVIDDNGTIVSDSNAILVYLAKKYDASGTWLPEDAVAAAAVQRWLSVAAGQVAFGPAAARLVHVFGAELNHDFAATISGKVLDVMNGWLEGRTFLAGDTITVADIANYTYIAHAPEGAISLTPYPNVQAWLARIEAQPNFVGMVKSPIPAAA